MIKMKKTYKKTNLNAKHFCINIIRRFITGKWIQVHFFGQQVHLKQQKE